VIVDSRKLSKARDIELILVGMPNGESSTAKIGLMQQIQK